MLKSVKARQRLENLLAVWEERLLLAISPPHPRPLTALKRYGLAAVFVTVSTIIRYALLPWIGITVPYNMAFFAVVAAAVLLGIGPGLFAVLLAIFFVEVFIIGAIPTRVDTEVLLRMVVALAMGVFVCFVVHTIRNALFRSRQSEQRLAAFSDATFEGIVESGAGRIIDCNEQFAAMTGYTQQELRGMTIRDLITPEDRQHVLANIEENRDSEIEHFLRRKDGKRLIVEARGRVVSPDSIRRLTAIRNVTESRNAEESLRESEAKYRSLFENMAEEVHFWKVVRDADGRIKTWQVVDVNPPTLKTWGRESIEETIGKTADEIFPGATAHYMPIVQKIMTEGVPYSFEDYFPPPVDKYFRFTSVPFGEYFITTGADITQRRHAEESLRQINERLEQIVIQRTRLYLLVASINEAIVRQRDRAKLLSEVCRIIVETGGFRLAWIGRLDTSSREVIVEESCGETAYLEGIRIVAADVPEGRGPTGRAIMEDRHIINADFEEDANMLPWRARARAHGIRSSSAFPLRIGGLVTGVLTIYSEKPSFFSEAEISLFLTITDNISFALTALTNEQRRLEAEEALRRINEDLEQRVAVRTHDLEVVNKELEAFSYSVSHDLRSPLRHMSGFVELLQTKLGDSTDQVMKDYMGAIVRASRKMTVLIESLLTFSRIGRSEMKCRKIDLNRLVKVAVAEIRPDTVGRDIKWDIGDMPEVYGDPFLLRLVFINIISNAVKFTGMCDHAEIEIGCKEENGEHLFFVRDNGAGFDMKFAGKLFGVFQRLHTQNEYEGTGIGLANAKRIISRHGGRIWAESAVGRGAAFYFTLPKISMES